MHRATAPVSGAGVNRVSGQRGAVSGPDTRRSQARRCDCPAKIARIWSAAVVPFRRDDPRRPKILLHKAVPAHPVTSRARGAGVSASCSRAPKSLLRGGGGGGEAGLQLIAQRHQRIDLCHDAKLFGEGWESDRNPIHSVFRQPTTSSARLFAQNECLEVWG
jgi:hypothetical protein